MNWNHLPFMSLQFFLTRYHETLSLWQFISIWSPDDLREHFPLSVWIVKYWQVGSPVPQFLIQSAAVGQQFVQSFDTFRHRKKTGLALYKLLMQRLVPLAKGSQSFLQQHFMVRCDRHLKGTLIPSCSCIHGFFTETVGSWIVATTLEKT